MMELDEAIAYEREEAKKNRKSYVWYSENPKVWNDGGKMKKECLFCAEEHEQRAAWLEELKAYREIGTVEECKNCVLDIVKAYNKAIDDFTRELKDMLITDYSIFDTDDIRILVDDIDEIAERLREV